MKTLTNQSPEDLRGQVTQSETKTQNENPSEFVPIGLEDILTPDYRAREEVLIDKSAQRALELSRKGIFACPQIIRFFCDDEDEVRIR
jgi:hypothetical protein